MLVHLLANRRAPPLGPDATVALTTTQRGGSRALRRNNLVDDLCGAAGGRGAMRSDCCRCAGEQDLLVLRCLELVGGAQDLSRTITVSEDRG
jgi:hypothetical protein